MAAREVAKTCLLSDGKVVGISEYGDPAGIPLIYFHGWPSSSLQAASTHDLAIQRGVRVIAIDRPGMGTSDFVTNRTILDWPKVVAEVADASCAGNFHVMGVSGGGLYVLAVARQMAARLLSASVVCGAPNFHAVGGTEVLPHVYKLLLLLRNRFPWLLQPVFELGSWIAKRRADEFPVNKMLEHQISARDRHALAHQGELDIIARSFQYAWHGTVEPVLVDADVYLKPLGFNLAEIRFPVHFWHGDADKMIPIELGKRMADLVPTSIRHWMPEEGHFSLPVNCLNEIWTSAGL